MARDYILSTRDEARLAVWHRQAQERKKSGRGAGPFITISREFGCQAYPLATELAKRLGEPWSVVDREILEDVEKVSGFSLEQIEKSRDTPAALKAIFAMFLDSTRAEETQIFTHLRQVICKFAAGGDCIIVGSGGAFATQSMANGLHLRLLAPLDFRVRKIMKTHNLDEGQAREFVSRHQKQRDDFIKRLGGVDVEDPLRYHCILNNARLSPEQMAEIAKSALSSLDFNT